MYKVSIEATGLEATVKSSSEVVFWIENEIGDYNNIAKDVGEWCNTAKIGGVYSKDLVVVTKEGDANERSK